MSRLRKQKRDSTPRFNVGDVVLIAASRSVFAGRTGTVTQISCDRMGWQYHLLYYGWFNEHEVLAHDPATA